MRRDAREQPIYWCSSSFEHCFDADTSDVTYQIDIRMASHRIFREAVWTAGRQSFTGAIGWLAREAECTKQAIRGICFWLRERPAWRENFTEVVARLHRRDQNADKHVRGKVERGG